MLPCDWFNNGHGNAAKVKLQNFSDKTARKILVFAQSYSWKNLYYNVIHPCKQRTLTGVHYSEPPSPITDNPVSQPLRVSFYF